MEAGSVTRSQGVVFGGYVLRMLVALAITACFGRILEPDAFGFYALVGTVFFVAQILLDLGSGAVATREIARDPGRERSLLEGLMGWRRLAGAGLAVVVVGMALLQSGAERQWVLLISAGVLLLNAPGALQPAFQVRQSMEGPAFAGVGTQLLILLGGLGMAAFRLVGPLFGLLIALRELVNARILLWLAVRKLGYRPRPGLRDRGLRPFMTMAVVQGLAVLIGSLYFHADIFIVRLLRGEAELGAYAAAYRPMNQLLTLPGLLMLPLLPVLSAAAAHDRERFRETTGRALVLMTALGALGATAGMTAAPELVQLLYGGRYLEGPLEAVTALRWMCGAFLAVFATAACGTALQADRGEGTLLRLALLGLVLNVGANLLLVPRLGFTAAALATAATEGAVGLLVVGAFLRRAGRLRLPPSGALPLLAGVLPLLALPLEGTPRLVACVTLGMVGLAVLLRSGAARSFRRELADL